MLKNVEVETVFPKFDPPLKSGAFIFLWWAWSGYLESIKQSQAEKQSAGDMAVAWVMGRMGSTLGEK